MYRLGLDIGATKTMMAIMDNVGHSLWRTKLLSADVLQGGVTPADALAGNILGFCQQAGIDFSVIDGIGIGFPGIMDRASQAITSCPNLPILDGLCLGPDLAERLGVPVLVENDVNLIALGEHFKGRGKGIPDLACVFVGSGIGCGLILRGSLYSGADGAAGEFGHTVVEPEGHLCTCGNRGCLEMYCSGKALALQAHSIVSQAGNKSSGQAAGSPVRWVDAELVIRAARAGHPAALEAMRKAFHYLGLGIANLTNILNPRLVILGGGIVAGWPAGIDIVRETVQARARAVVRDRVVIDTPALGEEAGLVGAFVLVGGKDNSAVEKVPHPGKF